jgi:hypothetical protein
VLPKWADLRIYLTADFDIGSGVTVAFGVKGFLWVHPTKLLPQQQQLTAWNPTVFPVDQRSLQAEEREFLRLLDLINQMMAQATKVTANPTVQVYIWDSVTYEHLVRVIGRHLPRIIGNKQLKHLAWLFPPDKVVANPDVSDRKSPISIVRDVVRAVVATPVPHYYSLLNVAREYHSARTVAPFNLFQVPNLFEDPLSDQIPSERAHEIWSKSGPRQWNVQLRLLEQTVKTKINAVESVTQRLGDDLSQLSQTAPRITDLGPPSLPAKMSHDARLWFVFARLNSALAELDVQRTRAMPPHEREARFKSAYLTRRLVGAAAATHLTRLGLAPSQSRWVYELAPSSCEVRARESDMGFALAPLAMPGFLERTIMQVTSNQPPAMPGRSSPYTPMEQVAAVTVAAVDRDQGILVVDVSSYWNPVLAAIEASGAVSFAQDVMLDPIHQDFILERMQATLNALGNPPIAQPLPGLALALGNTRKPTAGAPSPVADVMWDGARLAALPSGRQPALAAQRLAAGGVRLNPSQWQAWHDALSRRLQLIWGPPGTGKSRTLCATVMGAVHDALLRNAALRVLLTGPTYEAIDNVLLQVKTLLTQGALAAPGIVIARLRSASRPVPGRVPSGLDVPYGSPQHGQLLQRLQQSQGIMLVGGPVQQVHRLLVDAGSPVTPLFDVVVIDEASQLDVGTSTLALAGLADNGSLVVAGDPKQLSPIHQTEAPIGLEDFVGPVYTYLEKRHHLGAALLNTNYRSNATIVSLAAAAGYPQGLQAHSPQLRLHLATPLPTASTPPPGWPNSLLWTPEWAQLLDPMKPCSVFVYGEGRSSQWNAFEADAVAAMVWLLSQHMSAQLENELDDANAAMPLVSHRYTPSEFWSRGVGVVTPHRAQQALVISRLQSLFTGNAAPPPGSIRESVDTVERFQGQQRDVMFATFALGDPDAISDEDEFLLNLNRFNVMASRARAKLVVLVAREVVDHLSADPVVLRGSALLKSFVETFCSQGRTMTLGHIVATGAKSVAGEFRWR